MIDEKRCYFFGRNLDQCDFCIDHASCSRVHSVIVYHKHLKRVFLVDLGSTHGTFVGNTRIEPNKPTPIELNMNFRFGASTRIYTLREKPVQVQVARIDSEGVEEHTDGTCTLPENELELDVSINE